MTPKLRRLVVALLVGGAAVAAAPAVAPAQDVLLGVGATGMGSGVRVSPEGRFAGCSERFCYQRYAAGTTVRVVPAVAGAVGAQGPRFERWRGGCEHAQAICTLVLTAPRTLVLARFSPVMLLVTPTPGRGLVSASPSGAPCPDAGCTYYRYGTRVTLDAAACCGWRPDGWANPECLPFSGSCQVTLLDTVRVTPRFACDGDCVGISEGPLKSTVNLTISIRGPGSVRINGQLCRSPGCSRPFKRDIQLLVEPASGRLARWERDCARAGRRCQLTAQLNPVTNKPPAVTAVFR